MADCGAILNRSVFPECLWLIWHFSLNPSRRLCSLQLYLSLSVALSIFRWLFSVLIQGSHSLNIYHHVFLLILLTDVLCHHCPVSLNIPQVSFNQCELLSLLCAVNECTAFQAQGQKSLSVSVTPSFLSSDCRTSQPCTIFCKCTSWSGAVCFQLIKFGM